MRIKAGDSISPEWTSVVPSPLSATPTSVESRPESISISLSSAVRAFTDALRSGAALGVSPKLYALLTAQDRRLLLHAYRSAELLGYPMLEASKLALDVLRCRAPQAADPEGEQSQNDRTDVRRSGPVAGKALREGSRIAELSPAPRALASWKTPRSVLPSCGDESSATATLRCLPVLDRGEEVLARDVLVRCGDLGGILEPMVILELLAPDRPRAVDLGFLRKLVVSLAPLPGPHAKALEPVFIRRTARDALARAVAQLAPRLTLSAPVVTSGLAAGAVLMVARLIRDDAAPCAALTRFAALTASDRGLLRALYATAKAQNVGLGVVDDLARALVELRCIELDQRGARHADARAAHAGPQVPGVSVTETQTSAMKSEGSGENVSTESKGAAAKPAISLENGGPAIRGALQKPKGQFGAESCSPGPRSQLEAVSPALLELLVLEVGGGGDGKVAATDAVAELVRGLVGQLPDASRGELEGVFPSQTDTSWLPAGRKRAPAVESECGHPLVARELSSPRGDSDGTSDSHGEAAVLPVSDGMGPHEMRGAEQMLVHAADRQAEQPHEQRDGNDLEPCTARLWEGAQGAHASTQEETGAAGEQPHADFFPVPRRPDQGAHATPSNEAAAAGEQPHADFSPVPRRPDQPRFEPSSRELERSQTGFPEVPVASSGHRIGLVFADDAATPREVTSLPDLVHGRQERNDPGERSAAWDASRSHEVSFGPRQLDSFSGPQLVTQSLKAYERGGMSMRLQLPTPETGQKVAGEQLEQQVKAVLARATPLDLVQALGVEALLREAGALRTRAGTKPRTRAKSRRGLEAEQQADHEDAQRQRARTTRWLRFFRRRRAERRPAS